MKFLNYSIPGLSWILFSFFLVLLILLNSSCLNRCRGDLLTASERLKFQLVDTSGESLIGAFSRYDEDFLQIFDTTGIENTDFIVDPVSGDITINFFDWPIVLGETKSSTYYLRLSIMPIDTLKIQYKLESSDSRCGGEFFSDCKVTFNNEIIYDLSTENSGTKIYNIPSLKFKQ